MLKIAVHAEERAGNRLMVWWEGHGAARVFEYDDRALLMERATGQRSLCDLARGGGDDMASRILCDSIAALHAQTAAPPPDLVPLSRWFAGLEHAATTRNGILTKAYETSRDLLNGQRDVVALHGDIHHGNVLDFGKQGWRAIDPKGLIGDRCFDYANIFCNPDHATATAPGRLASQVAVVTNAAGLDRTRLLRWILAWAGLSAAWLLADGRSADTPLAVAAIAARELSR